MSNDLARLRDALAAVQRDSKDLRWADERPWRTDSHIWLEGRLPVVDLHDLDTRHARQAVSAVADVAHDLDGGAVCFVTGVGRHSVGPARLGHAVRKALKPLCAQHGWEQKPGPAGRQLLVIDRGRAPASATGGLGPLFWLGAVGFCAAAWVASPVAGAVITVMLVFFALLSWRDRRG